MGPKFFKRWEIIPTSGSHFDMLDGLRGIAILMVVAFHTFYTNPTGFVTKAIYGMILGGWMGVPIFFVLSGFLISLPFLQGRAADPQFWYTKGYALRRAAKIIPPFYLAISCFCIFYWVRFHDGVYLQEGLRWAFGFNSYSLPRVDFNLAFWSLMIEVHFYLILPFLFFVTRSLSLFKTVSFIALVLLLVPLLLRENCWPPGESFLPATKAGSAIRFFSEHFPLCLLDYFAFGIIFAAIFIWLKPRLADHRRLAGLGYAGMALIVFTVCLFAYYQTKDELLMYPRRWSRELFCYLPSLATFLMLFFILDRQSLGARFLSLGWLRFIGMISYEWFLFHGPAVEWFRQRFPNTHGSIPFYLFKSGCPLLLTFGLSVVVYRFFSLPIMNWARDKVKSSQK